MPDSAQSSLYSPSPDSSAKVYKSSYGQFSFLSNRPLQILLGTLVLLSGGFAAGYYYHQSQTKDNISPQNLQKLLPMPLEVITNSTIYDWQGSVEGNISDINEKDSTISAKRDKTIIRVHIVPKLTSITDARVTPGKVISLSDLKLNDLIRMTVWLPRDGTIPATGVPGDIVARYITVYNK